ncbi:hypothetical protein BH09ACT4_BH09ACT4_21990 [soil metagenome]
MKIAGIAAVPIALAAVLALAGCGTQPEPTPTDATSQAPTPSAAASQPPVARVFTMPTDCTQLLPATRQQSFADQGMSLLGGPGGKYEHYFADPTPEEQAGGISCIWGDEAVPGSTVTVSVAPLSIDTRGSVVDSLIAQGLNEAVLDDGISYAQLGDENSAPAVLNIIRDDSWISVIEALGGEAFFDEAVGLAGDAATQVYTP